MIINHWPQWYVIILTSICLLIGANMHGQPSKSKNNFWIALLGVILWWIPLIAIGFFDYL